MSPHGTCLPPSIFLPKLRSNQPPNGPILQTALRNLRAIYCPLRLPTCNHGSKIATPTNTDSGYVSEDDGRYEESDDRWSALQVDDFERDYATRWLMNLISHGESLPLSEQELSDTLDEAAFILASFSDSSNNDDDHTLCRGFSFPAADLTGAVCTIDIQLKDEPLSGTDHTDVGLQSWGASIIFSRSLCAEPSRFGLQCLTTQAKIVELGAGTGLISLTLTRLLPTLGLNSLSILATDYHPAVLENLRTNIHMNCLDTVEHEPSVQTAALDWRFPPASLSSSADMLIAADAVYAPEHAVWLRDCAASLLSPDGIFWLIVTVRSNGKFEGISDTVEAAFQEHIAPRTDKKHTLRILDMEIVERQKSIGRGDEIAYKLFKIGWGVRDTHWAALSQPDLRHRS